jgi:prevent-host-death family protein
VDTYSTYEAKSRFSEILRKVRQGRRVIVTHHGTQVAEIRPVEPAGKGLAARLEELEREGVIESSRDEAFKAQTVARRPGGLARFLATRD